MEDECFIINVTFERWVYNAQESNAYLLSLFLCSLGLHLLMVITILQFSEVRNSDVDVLSCYRQPPLTRASAMLLPTPYKCVSMVIVFLTNTLRAKCNFDLRSEVLLMWWAFRSCYYDILTRSQFLTRCRTCIEANITCSIS